MFPPETLNMIIEGSHKIVKQQLFSGTDILLIFRDTGLGRIKNAYMLNLSVFNRSLSIT
jgi:hypothetical protein